MLQMVKGMYMEKGHGLGRKITYHYEGCNGRRVESLACRFQGIDDMTEVELVNIDF